MGDKIKIIKRTDGLLVCETSDVEALDNGCIDGVDWPAEVRTLVINFSSPAKGIYRVIDRNLSGKYLVRLVYCADKAALTAGSCECSCAQIQEYGFSSPDELKKLYLFTEQEYFGKPWAEKLGAPWKRYLEGDYLKIIGANAERYLPKAKVACYAIEGRPVALLPLNKAVYFDGSSVDWITWVWIEPSLKKEERREISRRFVGWLKTQADSRIATGVNPFNAASNVFFERIGLKPECLQITRP